MSPNDRIEQKKCIYTLLNFLFFLFFWLFPVRSLDWLSHLSTQSYQQRKVMTAVTDILTVTFLTSFCDGLFLTSFPLCREIFVGTCPWTIWRFTCSNSPAGCMYIFCKYITVACCTVWLNAVMLRLLHWWGFDTASSMQTCALLSHYDPSASNWRNNFVASPVLVTSCVQVSSFLSSPSLLSLTL